MFPDEIIAEVERGFAYYRQLKSEYIGGLKKGCTDDCTPKDYECLKSTLKALENKIEVGEYDKEAKILVDKMLLIIGEFTALIPPTVSAGGDQSKTVGETGTATAIVTQGSAPIVSYLWEKVSGGDITLTNANTATVTYSNFSVGNYTIRVTVTDANGLTASDSFNLYATMNNQRVGFWGIKPTTGTLTKEQIEAGTPFVFLTGDSFTIPYNMITAGIVWFAYPSIEVSKNFYTDTINSLNKGWMLSDQDYIGAPVIVAQYKYQESYYPLIQPNPLRFSTEPI